MIAMHNDFNKTSKLKVVRYISYKLTSLIKEDELKRGLSLYDVFYKLVIEMAGDFQINQEVLRKYDEDVLTICYWAYNYRLVVGK